MTLIGMDELGGDILRMMGPFFANNHNLAEIRLYNCPLGCQGARTLASAKSLKLISLVNNEMNDEALAEVSQALGTLPKLEQLILARNNVGRNHCIEVASALQKMHTLHTLDIVNDDIDDKGVDYLTNALAENRTLYKLNLSGNPAITIRGYEILSTLLQNPNSVLGSLYLSGEADPDETWNVFSKLLCDTSSINSTFLSNHSLNRLCTGIRLHRSDIATNLKLNRIKDKKKVAIIKILQSHASFDMQPLFEWDFKVLPDVINWLDRATVCIHECDKSGGISLPNERNIKQRKLSTLYQFIQGMPMLYIESRLAQELKEAHTTEKRLRQELEEAVERRIRIMRKL